MPNLNDPVFNTFRSTRGKRVYNAQGKLAYLPLAGFWRDATCDEVACTHHLQGWSLKLHFSPSQTASDLADNQGAHRYIENSGREFTTRWEEGAVCIYQFPPGQKCFRQENPASKHIVPVERDPVFLHITGPDRFKQIDYDEYHTTFNESAHRAVGGIKEV